MCSLGPRMVFPSAEPGKKVSLAIKAVEQHETTHPGKRPSASGQRQPLHTASRPLPAPGE